MMKKSLGVSAMLGKCSTSGQQCNQINESVPSTWRSKRKAMARSLAFLLAILMMLGVFVNPAMAVQGGEQGIEPMEMDALAMSLAEAYELGEALPEEASISIEAMDALVEVIEIGNVAQLRSFLNGTLGRNDDHFVLTNNISLSTANATIDLTQGRGFSPNCGTTVFTGTFDGRGHTITNLRLRRTAAGSASTVGDVAGNVNHNTSVGFIRTAGDGARIENIRFQNTATTDANRTFTSTAGAGGANLRIGVVLGRVVSGSVTIENVHLLGNNTQMGIGHNATTTRIGGMVGHVEARSGVTLRDITTHEFQVLNNAGLTHSVGGVVGSSNGTVTVTASTTDTTTAMTTNTPPAIPNGRNHIRVTFQGSGRYDISNNANRAGGIIGYAAAGSHTTIEHTNVSQAGRLASTNIDAFVRGRHAGGFVGSTGSSGSLTIRNVANNVNVCGIGAQTRAGGIVGRTGMPTLIEHARNYGALHVASNENRFGGTAPTAGTVEATIATGVTMGGIVGRSDGVTTIRHAHNGGAVVSGTTTAGSTGRNHTSFLGGIVGRAENRITIEDTTNTAEVRRSRSSTRANNHVGGIIGHIHNGGSAANRRAELLNVTNTGNINPGTAVAPVNAGGIVGFIRDRASAVVRIENATNNGNVRARTNGGGIIGHANCRNILITGAMNYGNISTTVSGARRAGGIVGLSNRTQLRIFDSGNVGTITSASSGTAGAAGFGGLVGSSSGSNFRIERSFNTGFVNGGHFNTGGLFGRNTGSSVLLNVYNIGAVHSSSARGGSGILGRRVLGSVRIENAFVSFNGGTGANTGAGSGVAVATSGTGVARPVAGLTFRNVYVDSSTFGGLQSGNNNNNRSQNQRNGINTVTTELLTSGILPGISGGPWMTGLAWPDGEPVDPDIARTYPYFAWQTGGVLQQNFFNSIHLTGNTSARVMDLAGTGTRGVTFVGVTPALTRQTFNPYTAITAGAHPMGHANLAGLTRSPLSVGLISQNHVVGFSTGEVPDRIEIRAYCSDYYEATGQRWMIPWTEFDTDAEGTVTSINGLLLLEFIHVVDQLVTVDATATGYAPEHITLSQSQIDARRAYIGLRRVEIPVVVFVRNPQTEAQMDADPEQLGTIIDDTSWVRYTREAGTEITRNPGTGNNAFFLLPNALVREEGEASALGFSLEVFEVNPLDFRRDADGNYVMIDGRFVLDVHLEDIRLPQFGIVPFEYGTTANASGEYPMNRINIGPAGSPLRSLDINDPQGLDITAVRTLPTGAGNPSDTNPQRFTIGTSPILTNATTETEFQVYCNEGVFAPSDVFTVSPEDLEADTETHALFQANRVLAEMRRLANARVRVVEEVRIYDGDGNFVTAFENPVVNPTVLVEDRSAPVIARPEPGEFTVSAIEGNLITATAPGFVSADTGDLVAEHVVQEGDLVTGSEILIVMRRVVQAGHIYGHVLAIEAHEDADLDIDVAWGQAMADVRVVIRAGGPMGPIVYTTYTDENGFYITGEAFPPGTFYVSAVIPDAGLQPVQSHHNTLTLSASDNAGARADVLKVFEPIVTFDVTFDWGSWSGAPEAYVAEDVEVDTYADTIAPAEDDIPARSGYQFAGWAAEAGSTVVLDLSEYRLTEARRFYAVWEAYFTVTFVASPSTGGTLGGSTTATVVSGERVEEVPMPNAETGYVFSHWTSSAHAGEFETAADIAALTITENTTFTAVFVPDEHTITFVVSGNGTVDGAPSVSLAFVYGTELSLDDLPATAAGTGYRFDRWVQNPVGHRVTGSATFTAVFVPDEHTITFVVSGNGTVDGASSVSLAFVYGTELSLDDLPATLAGTGYRFDRWVQNPVGHRVTGSATFTAVFVPDEHTITFVVSGNGTVDGASSVTAGFVYGTELTADDLPATAAGTGYRFDRWVQNPVGHTVTGSATFTAVFVPVDIPPVYYDITFIVDGNGSLYGDASISRQQGTTLETTDVPVPIPANAGYRFDGWLPSEPVGHVVDGPQEFTAVFVPIPPTHGAITGIVVDQDGNPIYGATVVLRDESGNERRTTTDDEGKFSFAYLAPGDYELTVTASGFEAYTRDVVLAADETKELVITLYAEPAVYYTVRFDLNGGTSAAISPQTVAYGMQATQPANPSRSNYTFRAWTTDLAGANIWNFATGVTGDMTLYAQWTRNILLPPLPPDPPDEPDPDDTLQRQAFLIGNDGQIRPGDNITRAEAATIFFRLITDEARADYWMQTNPFPDVTLQNWFNNAVSTTANAGIFVGMPDGTFAPNQTITRGELATAVVRFMDVPTVEAFAGGDSFDDIAGHWARSYINAAAANGWVRGYADGTYRPDQPITRAETAAMINRIFGRLVESPEDLVEDMLIWPDNVNEDSWYFLYMQSAANSYTYEWRADSTYKIWLSIIEPRYWAGLERPGSTPHSFYR